MRGQGIPPHARRGEAGRAAGPRVLGRSRAAPSCVGVVVECGDGALPVDTVDWGDHHRAAGDLDTGLLLGAEGEAAGLAESRRKTSGKPHDVSGERS